ncbi:uncharacterized protein VTP21DRAFT_455 [Calcarisporiella thermophila]|uniref:uncharacterized protein n=1 Tax=Calcarisporiella thermophila TaxID=911321 RepID=UPI0037430CC6
MLAPRVAFMCPCTSEGAGESDAGRLEPVFVANEVTNRYSRQADLTDQEWAAQGFLRAGLSDRKTLCQPGRAVPAIRGNANPGGSRGSKRAARESPPDRQGASANQRRRVICSQLIWIPKPVARRDWRARTNTQGENKQREGRILCISSPLPANGPPSPLSRIGGEVAENRSTPASWRELCDHAWALGEQRGGGGWEPANKHRPSPQILASFFSLHRPPASSSTHPGRPTLLY